MKNKKILLVGHTMDRGGASHVLSILANRLAENGWDVELAFLRIRNTYNISAKVNLTALCQPDEVVGFCKAYKKLRNLYKNTKANIIISFLLPINCITLLTTIGLKKKIIISERNDPKEANSYWQFLMSKVLYLFADYCVFQTKRIQRYYSKRCRDKSTIILNPLDTTSFPQKNSYEEKSFVAVGKLWPQKNHLLLIDAFKECSNDYILKIYGEGPLRDKLNSRIIELGLSDRVFLMGNQPDVINKIIDDGIFVLSSNYEGLSNALMEAMCVGMPCISTKCAGADEIIKDGTNGLLVEVGNKQQLAEAMDLLAKDSVIRKKTGSEALKFRKECSSDAIVNEWIKIIERVDKC